MLNDNLWPCLLALTLLTLTPGVDTLLVIRNTARGGWKDGFASSLGICSGLFVHALLSAVGISVILLQSALAFSLLKFLGAGYLAWLGLCSLRSAISHKGLATLPSTEARAAKFQLQRSLREGLLSNVLNPKTIVFTWLFCRSLSILPAPPCSNRCCWPRSIFAWRCAINVRSHCW